MPSLETLLLFVVASFSLLVSPGPNMALVVSQGMANGSRGGVAVAFGIVIADLVLTVLITAGVAAILAAWSPLFDVLRFAGAAYLIRLAFISWRKRRTEALPSATLQSTWSIVRMSVITSLFNPKALLFFLVFLPQFVEPARGGLASQLFALGLVLTTLAFAFHATLGILSAKVRDWAGGKGASIVWLDRMQALVYFAIAVRLLALTRPRII